jgi:hypothetical protein
MRLPLITALLVYPGAFAPAQTPSAQPSFEVASVRPSQHEVGPDYDNQITRSSARFTGRNVTLRRLVAEAWQCRRDQVVGPAWLDHNEYDVEARLPDGATPEQIPLMLRGLLSDRFQLKAHNETRPTRVYDSPLRPAARASIPSRRGRQRPRDRDFTSMETCDSSPDFSLFRSRCPRQPAPACR